MSTIQYDQHRKIYLPDSVRPLNKGYGDAGASVYKRATKGYKAVSGSPREDIDMHNMTMRQRGRMMYMSAPVATSAVNTNRTNVVGTGLQLQPQIDREVLGMSKEQAAAWEKKTKREFYLWAGNKNACDATGVNDFDSMQQLALVSWLNSGDSLGVFKQYPVTPMTPYSLRLHIIEADRVGTPHIRTAYHPMMLTTGKAENGNRIFDGVEVDGNGRIVAYYIRNTYPLEPGLSETKWQRVEAYGKETGLPNMIHVMNSERPDQYRGISYLAQVIIPLLQISRYTESELMAAVIESFFTAFVKTNTPQGEGHNPYNEATSDPHVSDDYREYEMGPGQVNYMLPGEEVQFADPKRPSSGFPNFFRAICVQIGAALEIPADLLMKEFTSSYSASRAALLEAWKAFRMRRVWFVSDFCRPVYEVWMAEAVARGRINAPGFFTSPEIRAAYLGSDWIGPSQGQLDPVKEITAEILACSEGFSTREQSTIKLNGGQWDANAEQLKTENETLADINGTGDAMGAEAPTSLSRSVIKSIVQQVIIEAIKEGEEHDTKRRDAG